MVTGPAPCSGPHEYRLHLRADLYSTRHTQWFYFQVTGMEAGPTYTFHITNFVKKDSLYNYGQCRLNLCLGQ